MASKTCQICGQNSGYLPLCKQHMEDKEKGLIVKNEKTNKWVMAKNTVMNTETFEIKWCKNAPQYDNNKSLDDIESEKSNKKCILCGEKTKNGYLFCKDCYDNLEERQEKKDLDQNHDTSYFKEYYYNAKNFALNTNNEDKIYYQKLTMVSINGILKHVYDDYSLDNIIMNDLITIDNKENKTISNQKSSSIEKNADKKDIPEQSDQEQDNITDYNNVIIINDENKSRCITCGKKTEGLLFCTSCYRKYKNKELLFKITNCSNVELLDESYEGTYISKDGHILKSRIEREIDNHLFDNGIPHAYEQEIRYGAGEKDVLHPDFCLPNYLGKGKNVYIEYWGYEENNMKYTNTKKFKMPIYKQLGITLVNLYEKTDAKNIEAALIWKLKKENIKENEINCES